jgi:hypothetical protein
MKKQKSKLRLAKKVISTLRINSIKGGTNGGTTLGRTVGTPETNSNNNNC